MAIDLPQKSAVVNSLQRMLLPLMRFCIRKSISIQDVVESVKVSLVEAARRELEREGAKVTVSAISLRTGLRRPEVNRIFTLGNVRSAQPSTMEQILGRWQNDKRFQTKGGKPRLLSHGSPRSDFEKLVRIITKDIHPGIILSDLERLEHVEVTSKGVRLLKGHFVSKEDEAASYELLSRDIENLVLGVQENIDTPGKPQNLHGTTYYNNIRPRDLPAIRQWLVQQGSNSTERSECIWQSLIRI